MLRKLLTILTRSEKVALVFLSLGAIMLAVSETLSIGIIMPIMGIFLDPDKVQTSAILGAIYRIFGSPPIDAFLVVLIFSAMGSFILKAVYSVYMLYAQQDFVGNIYIRLTSSVLRAYIDKPYQFHLLNNSSALFKNLSVEVAQLTSGLLLPIVVIASESIVLAAIFLFLVYVYPWITIVLFIFFTIIIAATYLLFNKRIKAYSVDREHYTQDMHKTALEALHSVKEIKVFNVRDFFIGRFSRAASSYTGAFVRFNIVSGLPRYLFEVVLMMAMLSAIAASIFMHRSSSDLIPMMTVFGLASLRLVPSITKIYSGINMIHYSVKSLDITFAALGPAGSIHESCLVDEGMISLKSDAGSIEVKNVIFQYDGTHKPLFNGLSLSIPFGKVTAFVGRTGSGKSTLIDIVMGLLVPSNGEIVCYGKAMCLEDVTFYRERIGYVPQNIFLVDDSIAANIAFGVSGDKRDVGRIACSVRIAQLTSFIDGLPYGLDTVIGERGARISGGQKQRIGIARALYRDPDILILDEATSALDRRTEADVLDAISRLAKSGKTVIIVAHRLSTISHADLIYVMDAGSIADKGAYDELSKRCSLFQEIARQKDPVDSDDANRT